MTTGDTLYRETHSQGHGHALVIWERLAGHLFLKIICLDLIVITYINYPMTYIYFGALEQAGNESVFWDYCLENNICQSGEIFSPWRVRRDRMDGGSLIGYLEYSYANSNRTSKTEYHHHDGYIVNNSRWSMSNSSMVFSGYASTADDGMNFTSRSGKRG